MTDQVPVHRFGPRLRAEPGRVITRLFVPGEELPESASRGHVPGWLREVLNGLRPVPRGIAKALLGDPDLQMATLAKRIEDPSEVDNPNVVKVVSNFAGDAIYFSRCPIPYVREGSSVHFKHIGIYAYRRDFLLAYSNLPVGPLESVERLEQLRALENGYRIRVVETEYESLGVDTPQDLERVAALFEPSLSK